MSILFQILKLYWWVLNMLETKRHKDMKNTHHVITKNKSWHLHLQPKPQIWEQIEKKNWLHHIMVFFWTELNWSFLILIQNTKAQPSQHTLLVQNWQHFSQWFHCNSQTMHQPLWLTWSLLLIWKQNGKWFFFSMNFHKAAWFLFMCACRQYRQFV